jgi:aminoglycoside phosphotransferase family enzyme/predicted kinase
MSATKQGQPQDQESVLAFLVNNDPNCKRIDTHISIVFLGKDRVLKIKRAVRLPFLDFSTLEKRKHACEEELAVNSRFAPELYRRIIPITQGHVGLEIGGDGPVIEWAVEMARFDENKTFDHLAPAGHVTPELAETLAEAIRYSHERAEISDGSSWLASIEDIIDRNTRVFRDEPQLSREAINRLDAASRQRFADFRSLLRTRAAEGLVRRCHGDAHLGNITLIDGKPVLFDAIEFDPVIATTDVLYDLAFPIMDFCHFGLTACANRLMNGYLQATWAENAGALRLLPLFLSMRAAIRSNVLFTKRRLAPDKDHDAAGAHAYFDLALRHLEPARPSLIAIGGKSGTGKTVLARETAPLLPPLPGAILLRSDVIRKELFGINPLTALPAIAYTPEVTAQVYRTLLERSRQILAQGFSVVVDAAFLKQSERDELSMAAQTLDAVFHAIFLTADLGVRLDRIGARKRDASDATAEIATSQEDYEIGTIDWTIIDASGSPEQTLERAKPILVGG